MVQFKSETEKYETEEMRSHRDSHSGHSQRYCSKYGPQVFITNHRVCPLSTWMSRPIKAVFNFKFRGHWVGECGCEWTEMWLNFEHLPEVYLVPPLCELSSRFRTLCDASAHMNPLLICSWVSTQVIKFSDITGPSNHPDATWVSINTLRYNRFMEWLLISDALLTGAPGTSGHTSWVWSTQPV